MGAVKAFFIGLFMCFFEGWMLMLFLGGVHHEVLEAVRPIGYWTAFVLSLPLGSLLASYQIVQAMRVENIHKVVVGE